MQINKYLETYQPIIYKTFVNSLENDRLSHAFLIVGNPGTPLLEVSKHLAKSILCDNPSPLACDNCITCLRIEDNNYPDFIIFDGSKNAIKKEDVLEIEQRFEKKSFEKKSKMIYILHLIENANVSAVNSILKFLEEPEADVYAFLTTNNENMILPTIISRCQVYHLKQIDRETVIHDAVALGVEQEDAELLSYFYNSGELIFDFLNQNNKKDKKNKTKEEDSELEDYFASKDAFKKFLEILKEGNPKDAIFYVQNQIIPMIKTKESLRFFLDLLAQGFEDMISILNSKPIYLTSFTTTLNALSGKISNISEKLTDILKQRNLINLNLNIPLTLDHLIIHIVKD